MHRGCQGCLDPLRIVSPPSSASVVPVSAERSRCQEQQSTTSDSLLLVFGTRWSPETKGNTGTCAQTPWCCDCGGCCGCGRGCCACSGCVCRELTKGSLMSTKPYGLIVQPRKNNLHRTWRRESVPTPVVRSPNHNLIQFQMPPLFNTGIFIISPFS